MRIAQMSFGFSGGLWPTIFPLFQDSRFVQVSITDSLVVDRSRIFLFAAQWRLADKMPNEYWRPSTADHLFGESVIQKPGRFRNLPDECQSGSAR